MVRIDLFLFGYRVVTFPEQRAKDIANLLLRQGISAKIGSDSQLYLKNSDYLKLRDKLSPFEANCGEICGMPTYIRRIFASRGVLLALALVVFLLSFSSDLVWDIRLEDGCEVSRESVVEQLRSVGFEIGSRWSATDISSVETELLFSSDDVSWLNINRRGVVAYVSATPKIGESDESHGGGYSNIVAKYDCVIDEISVITGYAAVAVGDAVRAGDLLISGVIPESAGGGFCHAQGTVRGRVSTELSVSVERNEVKNVRAECRLSSVSLQIFNFSANIFKKYGNVDNGCDIIKDIEQLILFGKYRFPILLVKNYKQEYETRVVSYTDSELVSEAISRLMSLVKARMYSADVVAIKTYGDFSEVGYTAVSRLTVIVDVAGERYFTAE